MFANVWRDLAQAARALANARSFTLVSVLSLGIGMAPVIAIPYGARVFTIPPPGVATDGLVEVVTTRVGPRAETDTWSYPDFVALRDADTGAALTGWASGVSKTRIQTPSGAETASVQTLFVAANYFDMTGVALARGPGFVAGAAEPVVILGFRFWQNRQGSDPDIVGKTLTLDGVPHAVAGIAPDRFEGHLGFQEASIFVPLEQHPRLRAQDARSDRSEDWVRIHGRLRPGVSVAQASSAVSAVTSQLAKQFPVTNDFKAGIVVPYHPVGNFMSRDLAIIRVVGLTLTGMVLVVVCLNLSGMMQVRTAIRERELSIRQAIGATRGRLIQHLLAESALLAGLGAVLASVVLFNIPSTLSWLSGEPIPFQLERALRLDPSIAAICAGLCLATSLVFGWLPAARFSRPTIISSLKDDAGGGGLRVGRVHRVAAALQVAIGVPLLVMGGISLDRVRSTATADLGFASDLLYAAPLQFEAGTDVGFQIRKVRGELAGASGVAAVAVADGLPLDFRYRIKRVALQTDANVAPKIVAVQVTRVDDGYLDTMGILLLRGRGFTGEDRAGAELVTVISKPLADQLFPNADAAEALGKRLTYGAGERTERTLTIVGVTGDFPTSQMSTERPQLLLPLDQHADILRDSAPVGSDIDETPHLMLVARSAPGEQPAKMHAALEQVIRELDRDFKPARIVTGVWLRQNSMNDFLTQSAVAAVTGSVILLLSMLGIYGVVGL